MFENLKNTNRNTQTAWETKAWWKKKEKKKTGEPNLRSFSTQEKTSQLYLKLKRVFMWSRTTRYILDIACAAHVRAYRGTCTTGYRLQAPFYRSHTTSVQLQVQLQGAMRRSPPRRSQERASINSRECAWFVRETARSAMNAMRASAKYAAYF